MNKKMTHPESAAMNELAKIINNTLSLELRVHNFEVDTMIETMEHLGFKRKSSWGSMQLPNHTVIDFWRKELIKSSEPED